MDGSRLAIARSDVARRALKRSAQLQ